MEHGGATGIAYAWEVQWLSTGAKAGAWDPLPKSWQRLDRRRNAVKGDPVTTKPVRIGYCLSLPGPLAGNSRSAKLAHDIWQEEVNACGGLLGRPIELICHDDHADASGVPDIHQRLIDAEGVDVVIGGYGTDSLVRLCR